MTLERSDLDRAVALGVVTAEQVRELLRIASERQQTGADLDPQPSAQAAAQAIVLMNERPALNFQHLAFYLGGLIVVSAMGWFVAESWEKLGGLGFLLTGAGYGAAFLWAGSRLWSRPGGRVPGGLLVTMAVCMTPLAVYGIQVLADLWPAGGPSAYAHYWTRARSCWLGMEAATVLAGGLALRRFRFPFLTAPVALALWFMSMDLAPLLLGQERLAYEERAQVSLWFGLAMLLATFWGDRRTRDDYAFWGYLFGLLAFWGGLTSLEGTAELGRLGYCAVNVLLLVAAIVLERRVFLVFGGLGVCLYLGHLAQRVFRDSLAFPFVLSALGLGIMALGWAYQRHRTAVNAAVLGSLPAWVVRALPRNRVA